MDDCDCPPPEPCCDDCCSGSISPGPSYISYYEVTPDGPLTTFVGVVDAQGRVFGGPPEDGMFRDD